MINHTQYHTPCRLIRDSAPLINIVIIIGCVVMLATAILLGIDSATPQVEESYLKERYDIICNVSLDCNECVYVCECVGVCMKCSFMDLFSPSLSPPLSPSVPLSLRSSLPPFLSPSVPLSLCSSLPPFLSPSVPLSLHSSLPPSPSLSPSLPPSLSLSFSL